MFQKTIIFLLLCCLSFQSLYNLGLSGLYMLNKASIAARFCENKARPAMHCNGKCYLKKQINKATRERQDGSSEQRNTSSFSFFEVEAFYKIQPPERQAINIIRLFSIDPHAGFQSAIFHPPGSKAPLQGIA